MFDLQADGFLEIRQLCTGKWEIGSTAGNSRKMWQNVNSLLGETETSQKHSFPADQYHDMIDKKVAKIRASTASAAAPTYLSTDEPPLRQLKSMRVDDVIKAILSQCCTDRLPILLLKKCAPTLAPFITFITKESLLTERFPNRWKYAVIKPHLKKTGLDETEPSNYRPVPNLQFLSKLLYRIVHCQAAHHVLSNNVLPEFQSAYRSGQSKETAVLKVLF